MLVFLRIIAAGTEDVIGDRLLLAGGFDTTTTELMPVDGGESEPSFHLNPGRYGHCSIQPSPTTIILTGGSETPSLVTEYSGVGGPVEEVTTRELPSLKQGRDLHACGVYDRVRTVYCVSILLTLLLTDSHSGGWLLST